MIEVLPIAAVAPDAVEALLDRAFGTDRHGRTAYRIREGMTAIPALSLAAVEDGALIGTIQCWPIRFAGDDGGDVAMVQVGPVAVAPDRQQGGIGRMLTARALAAAEAAGLDDALTLIGDPEYYSRFFGFDAARTAAWRVPGPVERHRLLARGANVPTVAGLLGPRVAALV
ncbi:N-acetyltransferase [Sphingomonas sp. 10B4]|uniref:GNAT family N-acetyltransferase n=1 Tax=Sphingomonas sp. 10B4 TaxID=3048575 RepID=UPI002AB42063|nr:N-acetyltransferase [Sphingomonas sp. 10B4]MDY7523118.1 N-acetyltransferase [Sphingomonas sp. 10B4]MEB0284326.1 N-acetyltransferase [Sphingomonas sp. 10B4]